MTLNITIDHARSTHGSAHSSNTGSEGAEGASLSHHSELGSPDPSETSTDQGSLEEWAQRQQIPYPDEVQPSDSASRPRSSHRIRSAVPRTNSSSRPSRRHSVRDPDIISYRSRERRPLPPESVEPAEFDLGYAAPRPGPPRPHSFYGTHHQGYAHSNSSGASYAQYPQVSHHPSSQLVQYPPQTMHYGQPYHPPQAQLTHAHPPPPAAFYPPTHASPPPLASYGGSPMVPHELMQYHHGGQGYFPPYPQGYSMPRPVYTPFHAPQHRQSLSHAGTPPPDPPKDAPKDAPKDDKEIEEVYKKFEKMLLDERAERERKEAEREAEIQRATAAKKAAEEREASDKKIAEDAAAKATAVAEEAAAKKAAEEAEKAKKALEEAAEKAEADKAAAVAAAQPVPPEEKKAPIKFKDAVGRKFSFPFHLCAKWQGMEDLIRQAFMHVDVIGPHVVEGHYDLVGPNGDIILPQVWETVIEPDWTITMHMWPMPEKPKTPDPPPHDDVDVLVIDDTKPQKPGGGKKGPGGALPHRGSIPPLAPIAPKPDTAAKKAGPKLNKAKGGGWTSLFASSRPPKTSTKPAAAKAKPTKK